MTNLRGREGMSLIKKKCQGMKRWVLESNPLCQESETESGKKCVRNIEDQIISALLTIERTLDCIKLVNGKPF
jgi:hypothetical protein